MARVQGMGIEQIPRWPPQNRPLMATQNRPLNNDVRDKVFYSFSVY
jgi:hypothetical protein